MVHLLPASDREVRAVAAQIPGRWLDAYDCVAVRRPMAGLSALTAVERLRDVPGVVRLEHLELVPGLRRTVAAIIDEAESLLTPGQVVHGRTSVLYVASGHSTAGLHIDLHHNLFVHLRGRKRFGVAWYDAPASHQRAVERHFGGRADVGEPEHRHVFDLGPGDALYIPPYSLHWVESPDGFTVSAACSWSTSATDQTASLQRTNGRLSRLGLTTSPPGLHPTADRLKLATNPIVDRAFAAAASLSRHTRRLRSPGATLELGAPAPSKPHRGAGLAHARLEP
jgi:hypothetical protein